MISFFSEAQYLFLKNMEIFQQPIPLINCQEIILAFGRPI